MGILDFLKGLGEGAAPISPNKGGYNHNPEKDFVSRPPPPAPMNVNNSKAVWEIYVPTVSNEGKPFRTRHHKEWDNRVRRISGGLTILTPCLGQWTDVNSDKLYVERMIPVRIVCSEKDIVKIMKITAQHYTQIDILAYKISDRAIFLSEVGVK